MHSLWYRTLGLALILTPIGFAGCGGDSEGDAPAAAIKTGEQETQSEGESGPNEPPSDPKHPVVEMVTSLGTITLRLDAEKAPLTVDNFLTYVRQGHYDGTIFDQVYSDQGILGGLFTPEYVAKPTRTEIRNEADNGLTNRRGTIAMVRAANLIDSATAHFFINVRDNPSLDHQDRSVEGFGYCVFGEVIDGLDVVDQIAEVEVKQTEHFDQTPVRTVLIESVRQVR